MYVALLGSAFVSLLTVKFMCSLEQKSGLISLLHLQPYGHFSYNEYTDRTLLVEDETSKDACRTNCWLSSAEPTCKIVKSLIHVSYLCPSTITLLLNSPHTST